MSDFVVDVLIAGGGPAGLTASMLLSQLGVDSLLVSVRPTTSTLPKASLLNQRTMEIFSGLDVAEMVYEHGTPPENMRYSAWYAGLHGPTKDHGREIGRAECWGAGGQSPEWAAASPCLSTNLPQIRLEPILKARAEELAPGRVRFGHEVTGLAQGTDVIASIVDRSADEHYQVRSKYVLACDGGRTIGKLLGIQMDGPRDLVRMVSVHMSADLSSWARDPDVLIRWLWLPGEGVGAALVPTGPRRWGPESEEWTFHFSYRNDDPRALDDAAVIADMHAALGLPGLDAKIQAISRWSVEGVVARRFRQDRVFLLGDAAHRHPPTGALGLNSAVHDAHNLCWKLAATLAGRASDGLLDSYETERRPVTSDYVRRSLEYAMNHFLIDQQFSVPPGDDEAPRRLLRRVWSNDKTDEDYRKSLHRALAAMALEFDQHNVEYGYTYRSTAIVEDTSPTPPAVDPTRVYQPSTRPGHPLPHAWLTSDIGGRLSTLHLVRPGRFLLIAGEDGLDWCQAAAHVAAETAVPIDAVRIGRSAGDYLDPRSTWIRHRGISAQGAILIRPDRFVGWRSIHSAADPVAELTDAINTILVRTGGTSHVSSRRIDGHAQDARARSTQRMIIGERLSQTSSQVTEVARRRAVAMLGRVTDRHTDGYLERLLRLPLAQRILFEGMARSFRPSKAHEFGGTIQITLAFPATSGADVVWTLSVGKRRATALRGATHDPVVAIRLNAARFLQLASGRELVAVLMRDDGTFQVHGDLGLAMRIPEMFVDGTRTAG
jgi:2,4-dichlorophenol 6-monooxygenase